MDFFLFDFCFSTTEKKTFFLPKKQPDGVRFTTIRQSALLCWKDVFGQKNDEPSNMEL